MERIFIENRPKYPPKLLDETFREFTEALKTGGHEFQILRFNGEIVAFIRFDQLDDDNIYGGSLNVRSEVQNLAIGSAMLRATLNEKAKRFNIKAVVYEKNPMFDKYINDYGFEKGEAIENYRNTGEKFFKIEIKRRQ